MSAAEELQRLADLHRQGALTDAEFAQAKARLLNEPAGAPAAAPSAAAAGINTLRRSATDRWFGGVCAGIGRATGSESWVWRLLFVLAMLFFGTGLLIYILLWIFVPSE
ncbi:PspC domain-containing protein [Inhella gelatinilytica]|uniref:PspC domain-containing protein n=1 Tax=Inhella gelatinilytica TaxID=2795030 RepID=A0A931IUB9_9BURK|nr:PspC domain-containing protein [Inhella gelatinilytica]MBH9551666.1 PspC domain-containing protein [Inhella gelatinilytica]